MQSNHLHLDVFGTGKPLSLIHGWGAQNAVWRGWAHNYLAEHFEVHLIELPGFGSSPALEDSDKPKELAEQWIATIEKALPDNGFVLGWSLGGLLAQQLALQSPNKVEKLICLASTPRFTQTDNWSGAVSPKLMLDFMQAIQADSLATLKSFWTLQMQGSDVSRQSLRQFVKQMQSLQLPTFKGLSQGLELLSYFDFRDKLTDFTQPQLWLLGEKDPLIPHEFIHDYSKIAPQSQTTLITGAAHTPFVSHPQETADAIIQFLKN